MAGLYIYHHIAFAIKVGFEQERGIKNDSFDRWVRACFCNLNRPIGSDQGVRQPFKLFSSARVCKDPIRQRGTVHAPVSRHQFITPPTPELLHNLRPPQDFSIGLI